MGKSCEVKGFVTLVCNLVKCMGHEEVDPSSGHKDHRPKWQREYEIGAANELYEIPLSPCYAQQDAVFCQVVLDVLERSKGIAYLVGLVEHFSSRSDGKHTSVSAGAGGGSRKKVSINPGPAYRVWPDGLVRTSGIFIAPDPEAVKQCGAGEEMMCGDSPPGDDFGSWEEFSKVVPKAQQVLPGFESDADEMVVRRPGSRVAAAPEDLEDVDPRLLGNLRREHVLAAKQLVTLSKQRLRALQPQRPTAKLLARGGHIILMCTGTAGIKDFRLGTEHFVRPVHQVHATKNQVVSTSLAPVVVLAPMIPSDWEVVNKLSKVYFLQGSPLSEFDARRANVPGASAVVICNMGSGIMRHAEAWRIDAEAICCTRMVESMLASDSATSVVTELVVGNNHEFLPMKGRLSVQGGVGVEKAAQRRTSVRSLMLADLQRMMRKKTTLDHIKEWYADVSENVAQFFNSQISLSGGSSSSTKSSEYFHQARFASGHLFCGSMITSFAVNAFYNPTLVDLISAMINASVTLVEVPSLYVGRSYGDLFAYLLWTEEQLAIGLLRWTRDTVGLNGLRARTNLVDHMDTLLTGGSDPDSPGLSPRANNCKVQEQKFRFVLTAPRARGRALLESDQIICLSKSSPSPLG